MAEQQRTFDGQLVPTARLATDDVECSDGTTLNHSDVLYDSAGGAHSNEADRHEADVQVVTDFLNDVDKWVTEYTTENTDYADGFAFIVDEVSHEWTARIEEWLDTKYDDPTLSLLSQEIAESMSSDDCEAKYSYNEYAAYDGDGVCLFGTDIGEYEEQIEVNAHEVLSTLHDDGRLDDVLDDVNCDAYVSRSKRRVKNEATGHYENVGRETYNHHAEHPTFETYHMPDGRWDFIVSKERMDELLTEAIVAIARRQDG